MTPRTGQVLDGAAHRHRGLVERGLDDLQVRGAVGAVDDGLKFRRERRRPAAEVEAEVGDTGLTGDGDRREVAAKLTRGCQPPADAVDRRQVRIAEHIFAGKRRLGAVLPQPWTDRAGRLHETPGHRIRESRLEGHGAVEAHVPDGQIVNRKHERCAGAVARDEAELRIVRDEVVDDDVRRGFESAGAVATGQLVAGVAGRDGDPESARVDGVDVLAERRQQPDIDIEVIDADEGRQIRAIGQAKGEAPSAQTRPRHERQRDVLE